MPAYEVSRTLVKSQPEVWAELEQAERLAALLGDDAITITRSEPESTIEWEGSSASGTIEISSSGWGTKVCMKAEVTEPQPQAADEPPPAGEEEPPPPAAEEEPQPAAAEEEPLPAAEADPLPAAEADPLPAAEETAATAAKPLEQAENCSTVATVQRSTVATVLQETALESGDAVEQATKPGFWQRIKSAFAGGQVKPTDVAEPSGADLTDESADAEPAFEQEAVAEPQQEAVAEPQQEAVAEPEPEAVAEPEPEAVAEPEPEAVAEPVPEPEPEPTLSAEPVPALESVDIEQRMTALLDHLGAAHKRPFVAR